MRSPSAAETAATVTKLIRPRLSARDNAARSMPLRREMSLMLPWRRTASASCAQTAAPSGVS
jgi:hypothetical protein